jgi:hypothetical protein
LVLFCHSGCLLPSADGELPARELTIRVHFRYPSGSAINEPPLETLTTPFVATGAAAAGLRTPFRVVQVTALGSGHQAHAVPRSRGASASGPGPVDASDGSSGEDSLVEAEAPVGSPCA